MALKNILQKIQNFTFALGNFLDPSLNAKPMIKFIKQNYNKQDLIGAEIGVSRGDNAKNILMNLSVKKLYLIDPYLPYSQKKGLSRFSTNKDLASVELAAAKKQLKRYDTQIEFIKKMSDEALSDIPDNLDFVYIDGNHDYEFVKKDVELYYTKTKKNGVIGGHDFKSRYIGVVKAVTEFANKNGLELYGDDTDWWVVKK